LDLHRGGERKERDRKATKSSMGRTTKSMVAVCSALLCSAMLSQTQRERDVLAVSI